MASAEEQLLAAVEAKDLVSVKQLLQAKADPVALVWREVDGKRKKATAFTFAASAGDVGVVQLFLDAGVDVNFLEEGDFEVYNALMEAADCGHTPVVHLLLENGASVNLCTKKFHVTALWFSVASRQLECARVLLEKGADPEVADTIEKELKDDRTPLMYAASKDLTDMVLLLLEKGAKVNTQSSGGRTALWWAAGLGKLASARILLQQKGADVDLPDTSAYRLTPLMQSLILEENPDMVRLLLEKGANVNARASDGQTALCFAVSKGYIECARILLENGADTELGNTSRDDLTMTPLLGAIAKDRTDIFCLLLAKGAKINTRSHGKTPLWIAVTMAATYGKLEYARLLLEKGADPDLGDTSAGDGSNVAPLLEVTFRGAPDLLRLLLSKGANVDAKLVDGRTALSVAAQNGDIDCASLLINAGASLNVKDCDGDTPLLIALASRRTDVAMLLIRGGASVDVKTLSNNWTPLHYGACQNDLSLLDLLLQKGASVMAITAHGNSPYDIAVQNNQPQAAAFLKQRGGCPVVQKSGEVFIETLPQSVRRAAKEEALSQMKKVAVIVAKQVVAHAANAAMAGCCTVQ